MFAFFLILKTKSKIITIKQFVIIILNASDNDFGVVLSIQDP